MKWCWYICRENELLLDLDSEWRLRMALRKLEQADVVLQIMNVWVYPSISDGKWHVPVRLAHDTLTARQRIMWAWWAGSDAIRALYNLTRIEYNVCSPDLLIAPQKWVQYWREPDYVCHCVKKHKGTDACQRCPIFQQLHGKHTAAVYYPLGDKFTIKTGVQIWPPK